MELRAAGVIPKHSRGVLLPDGLSAVMGCDGVGVMIETGSGVGNFRTCDLVTLLDPCEDIRGKEARNRNLRISFTLMLTPMLRDLPQARAHHGAILSHCAELVNAGKLRIEVARTLPLEQAADAHRVVETGHAQGKLILVP